MDRTIQIAGLVDRLKNSDLYNDFSKIIHLKIKNEAGAGKILTNNTGRLTHEHLRGFIDLVDEPYPYTENGKFVRRPWFGRLLKPNALNLFKHDQVKINQWFNLVSNSLIPVEKRLDLLLKEPYKIKGLNVGFITLIFYILNKEHYLIWFRGQHEGLRLVYPELEEFTGKSEQYKVFNFAARNFADKYDFEHTELDWVFSTGLIKC